ncbi:hypothetical protein ANO11243_067740 [Dothideomycetidae sp. 11243]|nr:hypothetical protein ANO11243_067740 [fungal sp. No.11243]
MDTRPTLRQNGLTSTRVGTPNSTSVGLANVETVTGSGHPSDSSEAAGDVEQASIGHRALLQHQLAGLLGVDARRSAVVCVTSGAVAFQVLLRHLRGREDMVGRRQIIIPALALPTTVEAVIKEGFLPIFVDVDEHSWMISEEAIKTCISETIAAIIAVDWLGVQCDLVPLGILAKAHGVWLVADGTQSFGASLIVNPTMDHADAAIYSLNAQNALISAASPGVLVCPKSLASGMERHLDTTGQIGLLSDNMARQCINELAGLVSALSHCAQAAQRYGARFGCITGLIFQIATSNMQANHQRLSFAIVPRNFGYETSHIKDMFKRNNIPCNKGSAPWIQSKPRLVTSGRTHGSLTVGRMLAKNSITVPVRKETCLQRIHQICSLLEVMHRAAMNGPTLPWHDDNGLTVKDIRSEAAIDLGSKYRDHFVIPLSSGCDSYSYVLRPYGDTEASQMSMMEFLDHFSRRRTWQSGQKVTDSLVVFAATDSLVVLGPLLEKWIQGRNIPGVLLNLGDSSSEVSLFRQTNGTFVVYKKACGEGVHGYGSQLMRNQALFWWANAAARKTDLFVVPERIDITEGGISLLFPYVPSHSLADLVFANIGTQSALETCVDLFTRMSIDLWKNGQSPVAAGFLEQMYLRRMERHLKVASNEHEMLRRILEQDLIFLNGRNMKGFNHIMERLRTCTQLESVEPRTMSAIHGNLSIDNIICLLDPTQTTQVMLVSPRCVSLDAQDKFELCDYAYDISKLQASLSGILEIKMGLYNFTADGSWYDLEIQQHPAAKSISETAARLIRALSGNKAMEQWICSVEQHGQHSLEIRILLGEAAHFMAECATALTQAAEQRVMPLFLLGLQKLNTLLSLLDGIVAHPLPSPERHFASEGPEFGVNMIQSAIFRSCKSEVSRQIFPYDVFEICAEPEAAEAIRRLLCTLIGTHLPISTAVFVTTGSPKNVAACALAAIPCVLIHSFVGVAGQTHMLALARRRTASFFRAHGASDEAVDGLRVVHVSSTGSSARPPLTSVLGDVLLSPGAFGISPLKLALMQAYQLHFPKPGRWVLESDSFLLSSRPLRFTGDNVCFLVVERALSQSRSPSNAHACEVRDVDGASFVEAFCDTSSDSNKNGLLRMAAGIFLPHTFAAQIASNEVIYACRSSPLLIDIVLPQFMSYQDWIHVCIQQDFRLGCSERVWNLAQLYRSNPRRVEVVSAGTSPSLYHYGSDAEYIAFLASVRGDRCLNSLAYVTPAAEWRERCQERRHADGMDCDRL